MKKKHGLSGWADHYDIDVRSENNVIVNGCRLETVLENAMRGARTKHPLCQPIHPYTGRMPLGLASTLISEMSGSARGSGTALNRQHVVLDPFCGGGTVALAARLANQQSANVDLNPLAIKLTRTRCALPTYSQKVRFEEYVKEIQQRSFTRVRERTRIKPLIPPHLWRFFAPHILLELSGLMTEIREVAKLSPALTHLEVVFSAMITKFSDERRQPQQRREIHPHKAAQGHGRKTLRKGLPTEFFGRKTKELLAHWNTLATLAQGDGEARTMLRTGSALKLPQALGNTRATLVVSSPPYGGTYDYVDHHRLRYPWLRMDSREFQREELGARRFFNKSKEDTVKLRLRWDTQVEWFLRSMHRVLVGPAWCFLLVGDAQLGTCRVDASEQLRSLAPKAGFSWQGSASELRHDWQGGGARREHLVALQRINR